MRVARVALPDGSVVVAEVTEDGFRPVTEIGRAHV